MATNLQALGDEIFARYSPYPGAGLRHHCQRVSAFIDLLLDAERDPFPRDLVYLLAMVHDLGLVSTIDQGANYLQRSAALFQRETQHLTLPIGDRDLLQQMLCFNHRILPNPGHARPIELFRRAVWIEHTRGLRSYGLSRRKIAAVFSSFPRDNFDRVLLDFAARTLRHEPLTVVHGIFF